ncbi:MAG: hypothetical protein ACE5HA_09605 [Anaerolineae bacterium]
MRFLLCLILSLTIAGCATALPPPPPAPFSSPPAPSAPRPDDFRKLGPDLRRHLLQRGRQALEAPDTVGEQLRPVPVVIQAHSDITDELERLGVRVRSAIQDGVVVITADVPPATIPSLLALAEVMTMELAQPVPPAEDDGGREAGGGD